MAKPAKRTKTPARVRRGHAARGVAAPRKSPAGSSVGNVSSTTRAPLTTPARGDQKGRHTPWPVLQIALDEVNLDRAIQYAKEAVAGGADWVEAGTPLIKSCGLDAVRELKRRFPHATIVADMKTMDTGAFETEMACKAGADVVGILGAASDGTLKEAVKAARKYGSRIYCDLIGLSDKVARAKDAERFGFDYVCLHIGVDEQMKAGKAGAPGGPMETITKVAAATRLPVMAAGGLNSETIGPAVAAGASILIVGGALTKAPDIQLAAKTLKTAMRTKGVIPTKLYKKYSQEELQQAFLQCSTSNVSDAMHRKGAMVGIEARQQGARIAGRAVTVFTADGDWAKPVEAIDVAKAGEIIVIDQRGTTTAMWGELASWSCKVKGVAGVVIDGAIRDIDDIRSMGFPAWSRHVVPHAGEPKGLGEIGGEIKCGGQAVRHGDWIVADDMGVVVVPQEEAQEVANRSVEVHEREGRLREEIRRGKTLSSVLNLKKWEKVVG